MKKFNYFDIINYDKKLISRLIEIMHIPSSFDGYTLVKKQNWSILYFEPEDFHLEMSEEFKSFFNIFFDKETYLIGLPLKDRGKSEIDFLKVNSYNDFIELWEYYTIDNYSSDKYLDSDNKDFIIEQFFFSQDFGVFNNNLDWVFYNSVDTNINAILYSNNIKEQVEEIFKNSFHKLTVEDIRRHVPNFDKKQW